jgi:hypothetical protein
MNIYIVPPNKMKQPTRRLFIFGLSLSRKGTLVILIGIRGRTFWRKASFLINVSLKTGGVVFSYTNEIDHMNV